MKRTLFFILIFLSLKTVSNAQTFTDTTAVTVTDSNNNSPIFKDTVLATPSLDSISWRQRIDTNWIINKSSFSSPTFIWQVLERNSFYDFKTRPVPKEDAAIKKYNGKELLFYLLIFLLIAFATLRQLFPKYFIDLFRVFFRTTLKQTQIREQLMQTPFPSLMLNVFFVICAGLYIGLLLEYYNMNPVGNFWLMFFYSCIGLSIAYMVKFLGLKIAGWVFDINEATDAYIFIVFIINKMIGILLLPLIIMLAFSKGDVFTVSITISWCLLAVIYLYRIILTYAVIRNQIKVNPFHFFLYFCAFEIAPLLLVYRGLLVFFNVTT